MGDVCGLPQHERSPFERTFFLNALAWLFASGHAVDIVLAVLAVEYVWLVGAAKWRPRDALLRLAPGALMMVALRGALTGQDWRWIALPLLLSFPAHLADLARPPKQPDEVDR